MIKTKSKITKQEIARWIAVLPAAIITLLFYGEFSSWLNKIYIVNFHGDGDSYFTIYIDCIAIPLIILGCGYFIPLKFKFRSALILVSFFTLITIYALFTNKYLNHTFNPFIVIYFLTAILGLYGIYKLDKR